MAVDCMTDGVFGSDELQQKVMTAFKGAVVSAFEGYWEKKPVFEEHENQRVAVRATGVISFRGDISASIFLGLPADVAANIVLKTMGIFMDPAGPELLDGLAELTNLVAGHAADNLEDVGVNVDMSLPVVLEGDPGVGNEQSMFMSFVVGQDRFWIRLAMLSPEMIDIPTQYPNVSIAKTKESFERQLEDNYRQHVEAQSIVRKQLKRPSLYRRWLNSWLGWWESLDYDLESEVAVQEEDESDSELQTESIAPQSPESPAPHHMDMAINEFLELATESSGIPFRKIGSPRTFDPSSQEMGAKMTVLCQDRVVEVAVFGDKAGCSHFVRALYHFNEDTALAESSLVDALGETMNMLCGRLKRLFVSRGEKEVPQLGLPEFYIGEECSKYSVRKIATRCQAIASSKSTGDTIHLVCTERTRGNLLQEALCHVEEDTDGSLLAQALSLLVEWTDISAGSVQQQDVDTAEKLQSELIGLINVDSVDNHSLRYDIIKSLTLLYEIFSREDRPVWADRLLTSGVDCVLDKDAETQSMATEFVEEATEKLDEADGVLLKVEQGEPSTEEVNVLFRSFHTVKGSAGLFPLPQLGELAHYSESILSDVRDGDKKLEGLVLDSIFHSTALLRKQVDLVSSAIAGDGSVASMPIVAKHIGILKLVQEGATVPDLENAFTMEGLEETSNKESKAQETVKVDVDSIDRLARLVEALEELEQTESLSKESLEPIRRKISGICTRMRLVTLQGPFRKISRLARDLSKKLDKMAQLVIDGDDTKVPRAVAETISEPLTHMIRNAMDHGIETPDERKTTSKALLATIRLRAYYEESSVVVEISDDGRGIDAERVLARAKEKEIVAQDQELSPKEVYALIFEPGFSTAAQVTAVSGRGVGMDVVKNTITSIGGSIDIESTLGHGSCFKLCLPLGDDFVAEQELDGDDDSASGFDVSDLDTSGDLMFF
jgi:CheY-specific phosphatase CheX